MPRGMSRYLSGKRHFSPRKTRNVTKNLIVTGMEHDTGKVSACRLNDLLLSVFFVSFVDEVFAGRVHGSLPARHRVILFLLPPSGKDIHG